MLFQVCLNGFDDQVCVGQIIVSQVRVEHMARPVGHAERGHVSGRRQMVGLKET